MRTVYQIALVDESLCCGDTICVAVCPTGAIRMVDAIATIDDGKCAACRRCEDVCPRSAIRIVKRSTPMTLGVFPETLDTVDREHVFQLCEKAGMSPDEPVCLCTLTRARDIAAVIILGAKTPKEVSLMTGVRTYCAMWCGAPIQRLLLAHGLDFKAEENQETYPIKAALWNLPEEMNHKYPEYRISEDQESHRNGTMDNIASNLW